MRSIKTIKYLTSSTMVVLSFNFATKCIPITVFHITKFVRFFADFSDVYIVLWEWFFVFSIISWKKFGNNFKLRHTTWNLWQGEKMEKSVSFAFFHRQKSSFKFQFSFPLMRYEQWDFHRFHWFLIPPSRNHFWSAVTFYQVINFFIKQWKKL